MLAVDRSPIGRQAERGFGGDNRGTEGYVFSETDSFQKTEGMQRAIARAESLQHCGAT